MVLKHYPCYFSVDENKVFLEEMTRLYFFLSVYFGNSDCFEYFIEPMYILFEKINNTMVAKKQITPRHYLFFTNLIRNLLSTKYVDFVLKNILLISKVLLIDSMKEGTKYNVIIFKQSEIRSTS